MNYEGLSKLMLNWFNGFILAEEYSYFVKLRHIF
jgi:hypothetical protein